MRLLVKAITATFLIFTAHNPPSEKISMISKQKKQLFLVAK